MDSNVQISGDGASWIQVAQEREPYPSLSNRKLKSGNRRAEGSLFPKMGLEVLQFDRSSLRKILRTMFDQDDPTKSRYYKKQ
jgi:hypothetical protein